MESRERFSQSGVMYYSMPHNAVRAALGGIRGASGLPDCTVDMYDVLAVLKNWGGCE